ncbi:TonB-dependent receptor plug domain-containing protein [Paracoccus denitrificans]|jgi:vitamin B12 transporter|uniref:TonB-dependent receptor n=1 Tax=Paracoccus denitrificans (strain Pd 1222) TaxID=318586 RepID=A1B1S5_PARDP|nr:TonB-dependent receptor [Paracoccus denitrificans]ABL69469.1 TonB-dependent receptor [Paracoccus denitrificans PD1222]MBB4626717.1 vitamin B12 transporter [Paracoccus denitrificans]MCU7427797.1 TonB-dependent receptor [Paracoccus denitrificans]QAR25053.1 TonB-dependent receptor [Paracoccus denitrificans]UPV93767.1 TonB-dependent receptor [Paracoccus denitrificans]
MFHTRFLLLATSAFLPTIAMAQDGATDQPLLLDEIVISGGLTPLAADGYGRAHSVLTAKEIEARGITTVQDALRAMPGVAASSTGASFTQVRIRGAEANHTLILIDGIEATGGADEYILTGLETANIERIEVLRGPQSVFYGSNASAGVINIITRKGGPGLHYGGSFELGNGAAASAHVSQRTERGGIALNLSARDDHGYDQSGDGGEKDGINRKTIGLSGDWRASDDLAVGGTLRWSDEHYDYDATAWDATDADSYVVDDPDLFSERREFSGAVWAEYSMLDGQLTHRLEYQKTIYKQSYDGGPFSRGETEKLKYRLSYGLDGQPVDSANHVLNLLAERQKDQNSTAPDYRRDMKSLTVEYRGFLDNGLDIQAGIRHDDNKVFDDFTSWNLGLSYRIPGQPVRLHASAGSALVNPSYYELYADDAYTVGNSGLKPEINRGFDLGVEVEVLNGRGLIDVTYFNEKMEDEITYVYGAAPDGRASYVNQPGKSPREGVEVTGRLQATEDLSLALNYTYLDASNPDGSVEIRRPRHELGLSATLAFLQGRGSVTADLRHVSGNYDSQFWGAYSTEHLPTYTTVNLAAGYDLTNNVRLNARVVNLFDKDYSDVWGYASQGRTAYVGLQARW